jgi:hypothetical protein
MDRDMVDDVYVCCKTAVCGGMSGISSRVCKHCTGDSMVQAQRWNVPLLGEVRIHVELADFGTPRVYLDLFDSDQVDDLSDSCSVVRNIATDGLLLLLLLELNIFLLC